MPRRHTVHYRASEEEKARLAYIRNRLGLDSDSAALRHIVNAAVVAETGTEPTRNTPGVVHVKIQFDNTRKPLPA